MTNETGEGLERLSWMPDREAGLNGLRIGGQYYYDVELTGGAISNVTLTDVTINGTATARTERVITASGGVTVASDDYVITMNKTVSQITTITLPASPSTSRSIIVKDDKGDAGDFNITLDGNGKNIDGQSTYVIDADYGAVELIYNGTEWNVLNSYKTDGDVVGPVSSSDNAITRFDGTTGRVIQNSLASISDAGDLTAVTLASSVSTGTAPLTIASTTRVSNLNVTRSGLADTITVADAAGDTTTFPMLATSATGDLQPTTDAGLTYNATTNALTASTFVGALTGNASTSTTLATGRTIAITGDLAYTSPSFDGSTNVTAAGTLATVNSNVGSFTNASITVNAKGLITAASSGAASTNPGLETQCAGQFITGNYYVNSRGGLSASTDGQSADIWNQSILFFDRAVTCDEIGLQVTGGVASATSKITVYDSDANGWPNNRILETTDLDCSTTGFKSVSFSYTFLANTRYWVGVRSNSTHTLRAVALGGAYGLGLSATSTNTMFVRLTRTLTYATGAPATFTFTSTDLSAGSPPPIVSIRQA